MMVIMNKQQLKNIINQFWWLSCYVMLCEFVLIFVFLINFFCFGIKPDVGVFNLLVTLPFVLAFVVNIVTGYCYSILDELNE